MTLALERVGTERGAETSIGPWAEHNPRGESSSSGGAGVAGFYPSARDQRQVRTLETSRSVRRSAQDVSVVAGRVGARRRRYHAQKEGGRGARREREEDGAANVTLLAQRT